ncbi:MAG: peptidoglycan DD-metalloendopeptidase family protein [Nitrospinae bacterium]|nr:peptidoglycan DD-metalloendopeptidase family protein [Nitrospinota bacterium]
MGKKYTIMVIPSNSSRTRRLSITRGMLILLFSGFCTLAGTTLYLAQERIHTAKNLAKLSPLEKQNHTQKELLEKFNVKLQSLDNNLIQLKQLEDQLRIMASLKRDKRKDDLGVGGVSKDALPEDLEKLTPSEQRFIRRLNRQFQDIEQRAAEQESAFKDLLRAFRDKSVLLAHTPSIWPVKGWLSSSFGYRRSPFTNRREFHAGIDVVARVGTPIFAPADGVVISTKRMGGFGKTVRIQHMQGIVTTYAHNSVNLVKVGQRVRRGDIIAKVGSTGRSTGPHLHYEVRINGVAVNPRLYIVK